MKNFHLVAEIAIIFSCVLVLRFILKKEDFSWLFCLTRLVLAIYATPQLLDSWRIALMIKKIVCAYVPFVAASLNCVAFPGIVKIEINKKTQEYSIVASGPLDVIQKLRSVSVEDSNKADRLILSWTLMCWNDVRAIADYFKENPNVFSNLVVLDLSYNFDLFAAYENELQTIDELFKLRPTLKFVDLASSFFGSRSTNLENIFLFYATYIDLQSKLPDGKFIIFMHQWRIVYDENRNRMSSALVKIIKAHNLYFSNFHLSN